MRNDLNKLTKIKREVYTRTYKVLDRVCESIPDARPGSYFILAYNCDSQFKDTIKYFIVSSHQSTIEVKLRALSELGLSSDTPANLTHKGRVMPDDSVPMSHRNYGITEKDLIHLNVGSYLPGGMMKRVFNKILGRSR